MQDSAAETARADRDVLGNVPVPPPPARAVIQKARRRTREPVLARPKRPPSVGAVMARRRPPAAGMHRRSISPSAGLAGTGLGGRIEQETVGAPPFR